MKSGRAKPSKGAAAVCRQKARCTTATRAANYMIKFADLLCCAIWRIKVQVDSGGYQRF